MRGGTAGFSFLNLDPGRRALAHEKVVRRMIRNARWNKLIVTLVVAATAVLPVVEAGAARSDVALFSGASLSLLVPLGFVVLYQIQVLPSLFSGESLAPLAQLPLSREGLSLIATMSLARALNYVVLAAVIAPTVALAVVTRSAGAALVELAGSSVNMVFATAISLLLARVFSNRMAAGGRSKVQTVIRLTFMLAWGLVVMSMSFFYYLMNYMAPVFGYVLDGTGLPALAVLLHPLPFSYGVVLLLRGGSPLGHAESLGAAAFYVALAAVAGSWILKTAGRVPVSGAGRAARTAVKEFGLRVRRPLMAYTVKDFRVASRNPAVAFAFAAPVLEAVIVTLTVSSSTAVGFAPLLIGAFIGGAFSSFTTFALLNAEGTGFEYTRALPIPTSVTIRSKSLVATLSYLPVPAMFIVLAAWGRVRDLAFLPVPYVEILGVAASAMLGIRMFYKMANRGEVVAFNPSSGTAYFFTAMAMGMLVTALPLAAFGFAQAAFHQLSLLACLAVAAVEFLVALRLTSDTS